jgi:ureidoglycolate lyase
VDGQRVILAVEPLTAREFVPYGDVIEAREDTPLHEINRGFAKRFDGLATIDTAAAGGATAVAIVRALPRALPFNVVMLERHSLGSQAFVPLTAQAYLVVVAPAGPVPQVASLRCFVCAKGQGVNYSRGTWHHPLLAIDAESDFLVVDRAGPSGEVDCEEHWLQGANVWIPALAMRDGALSAAGRCGSSSLDRG